MHASCLCTCTCTCIKHAHHCTETVNPSVNHRENKYVFVLLSHRKARVKYSRLIDNGESCAVQTTKVDASCLHVDGDAAFIFIQLPVKNSCRRQRKVQRIIMIRNQFTCIQNTVGCDHRLNCMHSLLHSEHNWVEFVDDTRQLKLTLSLCFGCNGHQNAQKKERVCSFWPFAVSHCCLRSCAVQL